MAELKRTQRTSHTAKFGSESHIKDTSPIDLCLSQQALPTSQKIIRSSLTTGIRKNLIKINKNKFPSDFFNNKKTERVSASVPKRNESQLPTFPLVYKFSLKQFDTNAYSGYQKTEEEESEEDLMKLTSCFGSLVPHQQQKPPNQKYVEKKYFSHQNMKEKINLQRSDIQGGSKDSKPLRNVKKPVFFGNVKIPKRNNFQLPELNVSPLRKRIEVSRKLSGDNFSKIQFQNKLAALINNSSLPPQPGPLYLNSDRPKCNQTGDFESGFFQFEDKMGVTFFKLQRKKNF